MRILALVPVALIGACSAPAIEAPSLAPRAAEAIDPRVPIAEAATVGPAAPALLARISELLAVVRSGDLAFQATAVEVERLAADAGAVESESWIEAQQALSALIAARAPVATAIADLDGLATTRLVNSGGIPPGDLAALQAATQEAWTVGEREAATIGRLQARLAN